MLYTLEYDNLRTNWATYTIWYILMHLKVSNEFKNGWHWPFQGCRGQNMLFLGTLNVITKDQIVRGSQDLI